MCERLCGKKSITRLPVRRGKLPTASGFPAGKRTTRFPD
jgi:hypothetical protein